MLLDDEAATIRRLDRVLTAWLLGLPEVALLLVGGQLVVRHRHLVGSQAKNASYKDMFRKADGAARQDKWRSINPGLRFATV